VSRLVHVAGAGRSIPYAKPNHHPRDLRRTALPVCLKRVCAPERSSLQRSMQGNADRLGFARLSLGSCAGEPPRAPGGIGSSRLPELHALACSNSTGRRAPSPVVDELLGTTLDRLLCDRRRICAVGSMGHARRPSIRGLEPVHLRPPPACRWARLRGRPAGFSTVWTMALPSRTAQTSGRGHGTHPKGSGLSVGRQQSFEPR
jgi:hypothetical protein